MAPEPLQNGSVSTTAQIMVDWIPKADRPAFLLALVRSLRADDSISINFVAALVVRSSDSHAKIEFLSFLTQSIQDGHVDPAVQICSQHLELGVDLLERAVQVVTDAVVVHPLDKSNRESTYSDDDSTRNSLEFARIVISTLPFSVAHMDLFFRCLDLVISPGSSLLTTAFSLVLKLINLDDRDCNTFMADQWALVRETNTTLILFSSGENILQGYSLWLRYILAAPCQSWRDTIDREYWHMLLRGLRHGDSERRKLCLNIIKLSIAADQSIVSDDVRRQYERYCTVFETIVLGRYINQIQECEADLDALTNNKAIERRWLYVLLASALDLQMQDSNRKFIGNWIMQSDLHPDLGFLDFFRGDFLPWAIQGHLFVSSLKNDRGVLHCTHGDSLASFIQRLQTESIGALADTIVDVVHQKCNTIFAYAVVYLLEGVADLLQPKHMSLIAAVKALPEVARDYVKLKASTIGGSPVESKAQSRRETMEQATIDKCSKVNVDATVLNEIWADLEYLEFPKRLLMAMPKAIFSSGIIATADEEEGVAASLRERLRILQNACSTKTYLFSPLVGAVRQAILANTIAASVLPVADFVIQIIEHPPEPTIDLMLEEATLHLTPYEYKDYFGERPSYGFAALVDLVSRLKNHQGILETILDHILLKWKAQKVPPPTISAWKNTLQLQIMLLCFEQYKFGSTTRIHELLESLFHILAIEPLPRYRYLLEATIVRIIIRSNPQETIIERLNNKDHHANPKHLASLMKIGTILACREKSTSEFTERLAAAFVPLAASSKVVIRHEAQWQVPILMNCCYSKSLTVVTQNPAYVALDSYISSLERFSDPPRERRIGTFDPEKDLTLSNLVEGQWFDLDELEPPLTSHDEFVKIYADGVPPSAPATCIPLGNKVHRATRQSNEVHSTTTPPPSLGPRTAIELTALQTKGAAYLARTLSDPVSHTKRPHDLIVIGSLVDNPYNLGGLSRVSEIFGASALTLQNQNVISNRDFTSVSVSSHLHFPIIQLSAPNIPCFLAERKAEGYTVVGIEQTDRSVMLGSEACELPKKVVLVLGSEKEGIPAVVLTECDVLVEVPQFGVTRSLNVQTAVGIVLFEYVRQYGKGA